MMKHDSDSYKIVLKAEALVREAYCLFNSNSRSETIPSKVHLKSVVDDLRELTKAVEDFSAIFEGWK